MFIISIYFKYFHYIPFLYTFQFKNLSLNKTQIFSKYLPNT